MARPLKPSLEYYPHDVNMTEDVKWKLIIRKFGLEIYGLFTILCDLIFGQYGYYIKLTQEEVDLLLSDWGMSKERYDLLLSALFEKQFFDKEKYDAYGIFTSEEIQKVYLRGKTRSTKTIFIKEYALFDIVEYVENSGGRFPLVLRTLLGEVIQESSVGIDVKGINVNNNSISVNSNTQSKVNERKRNINTESSGDLTPTGSKDIEPIVEKLIKKRREEQSTGGNNV